jgi:hypothetical protein
MSFISSYKHLEKLCGEVLNDSRRISAYIDEMQNTPNGAFYVHSWDEDLKTLKHYRWVRNQIAHEPDCDEQSMCDPSDALWLDDFYSRIMNQTDPLALYRKASAPRRTPKDNHINTIADAQPDMYSNNTPKKAVGFFVLLLAVIMIILIAVFCLR